MANEGMDFELLVNIKKAEQQIDKFIKDTEKKFNNTNYSPLGSGSKGGRSTSSATKNVLNDEKKAAESLRRQRIKANDKDLRDQERAAESLKKQRQKAHKDQIDEIDRTQKQIQKIHRDALHKYELMEIQRNRAGKNATEQSKKVRLEYEREIARIIARAGSNNITQTKQELARELAIRRKALDQRVMSEKQAAAQALAAKNHSQKQASKFNNTMFQVQQAVEDASYAGFRGASNNLALMANQLGGPGGTIALMGLMATTMTPTIAKMIGFGEETKIAADEVERLTQSIKRNNDAKLNAQIETNSLPLTPKELSQRKEDLNTRKRNFEARRRNFNSQKNFAAQSINTRLFNDEVRQQLEMSKMHVNSPLPGIFLDNKTTQEKIKSMGINQADIKGKTTQETLQNLTNELHAKAAMQEQKLFDSQNDVSAKEFRGMQIKSGAERGLLDRKNLLKLSNEIRDDQAEVRRGLLDEQKNLEELSKSLGTNNKTVTDVMGILDKGTDLVDFSKYKTGDVPHTQEDRLKQQNSLMEDQLQQRVDDIKKNFGTFIEDKVNWITRATTDSSREWRASQSKIMVEEKQKEITSELQKQTDLYTKKIDANNQLIDTLDKVENAHKRIGNEVERSVKAQQKKIESLKEALTITKNEYEYDKLAANSNVEQMKVQEQGKKQMNQAKAFANKRFDPMIKYLQYMSKSPVFGQAASQQLQAVQNAKGTFLNKAQNKISKLTEKKLYKKQQDLIASQSKNLEDKANAAGNAGNFESQQKYLERLQALQLQASGSAKTSQEAQKYLDEADRIQTKIESSLSSQVTTEKQSLNELTKIEAQLAQIKSILQGNPNSAQAKQAQSTLNGLQSKVTAINEGKPLPNVPVPTLPTALTKPFGPFQAGSSFVGKTAQANPFQSGSSFVGKTIQDQQGMNQIPPRVNPAPIVPQDKPQSLKDIIREMERDSVTQTQSVQTQSVTQAQSNQTMTNSATISNAVINSATINGVINDKTPTPAVAGSSVSNVMNNRFGSLNVNVKGPRLPNIGKQLQRQARNQSIRMG